MPITISEKDDIIGSVIYEEYGSDEMILEFFTVPQKQRTKETKPTDEKKPTDETKPSDEKKLMDETKPTDEVKHIDYSQRPLA